jgi:GNAT superfamily N-acetyltransferase
MPETIVTLRSATPADAAAIADVYLASRKAFVAFAPRAHTDAEVREWVAVTLVPAGGTTVAVDDNAVVGMMALSRDAGVGWIDQLYLLPGATGRGIGARLLAQAKTELGAPIRLYTFQANDGARRFYEQHWFAPIAFGDGQDNEERCPDVLYEWIGTE